MKNSQIQLLKLARKLFKKYGQSQSLQEIIGNAALYGEHSANGIMNFPTKLKQDGADLSININISGNTVAVSEPTVTPTEFAGNYARLPDQIKNYLQRHINDFPLPQGTTTLQFVGGTGGIAKN